MFVLLECHLKRSSPFRIVFDLYRVRNRMEVVHFPNFFVKIGNARRIQIPIPAS